MTAPTSDRVVIVGGGHAGVQAAFSLRAEGYRGQIELLVREQCTPYERPPLSKSWLKAGSHDVEDIAFRSLIAYRDNHIDLVQGAEVVGIDRSEAQVHCSDGRAVPYDHLILATGALPRSLPLTGSDLPGVHHLHTIEDAARLMDSLPDARSIVVIGGGFIGLEVAAAASIRQVKVTVIEAASRLMQRAVTEETSSFFDAIHSAAGTEIRYGVCVDAILAGENGRVAAVRLEGGETLPAAVVVVGIGVRPAVELAEAAGLLVDDGVVVDATLTTSDPAISAIGDCARFPSALSDSGSLRLESVQNAVDHARCVARKIVGAPTPYGETPWFWTDQHECKLQMAGLIADHDTRVLLGDVSAKKFSVLCWKADRFLGAESVNRPGDHIAVRKLLALPGGTSLTAVEAAAGDFDLKTYAREATGAALAAQSG